MKTRVLIGLALGLSAFGLIAGAQQKRLNLFIWSEYIDVAVVKSFEKATGARVVTTLYESNEDMLAKLQSGGTRQYDVVVPSSYIIPVMVKQNLLRPLDQSKLPNLKNLGKTFLNPVFDPGNRYSVGYLFSITGVTYRKDRIRNPEASWALFFDKAKQPGPFVMLDDSRSMIGIAMKYLGKPYNSVKTEDLKAAIDLLLEAKARALAFTGSPEGANRVLSKQAVMAITYNTEAVKAATEDPQIGFLIPKEGSEIALDNMVIPAQSPSADLAHSFINFMLDARNAAQNATGVSASTPNQAARAFLTKSVRENPAIYPSDAVLKTLEYAQDLGSGQRLLDAAWTKIKAR